MAYKGTMKTLTINGNTYQVSGGDGLTAEVKEALLNCFEHVAWTDEHGQDYVDALEAALYPPAELASISAVYTQSGTVYTTDTLDSLKTNLVVTAHYTDSTTETVTTYTLSGTLTEGTSVITVSYGGKTTTFNVTVTAPATLSSITAVYTQSGTVYDTDTLDSLKSDLVVTAVYSDSTTETVASSDYTLSGTLTEGTSTITVSYGGKSTTFTVTVTHTAGNPFDNVHWNDGTRLTGDKEYTGQNNYSTTDYVDVSDISSVTLTMLSAVGNIQYYVCWYTSNNNDSYVSHDTGYINYSSGTYPATITSSKPSTAVYCRICVTKGTSGGVSEFPYANGALEITVQ